VDDSAILINGEIRIKELTFDVINVTTLVLGLRPRQRLAKMWAKSEA